MATTTILGKEIDALSALSALSASYATTASYALTAQTLLGSVTSASFASTASYALSAAAFPFTGSARITGSLGVTGSFNQGLLSLATGLFAHAQGSAVTASGDYSHAEGVYTRATGQYSHAEGSNTLASGDYSHAEGETTTASGTNSHAEGYFTGATGSYSHAEGNGSKASGSYSHAEGAGTLAIGDASHAEGAFTVASGAYQHVQGQYNISSSAQSAFILGNGTGNGALRSNLIFASASVVQVTGSVIATAGFTGSLQGTASWANNATTATSASTHTVTTNALHYPVFVDTNNASPATEKLGTVGNLTYNPSIGSLNATSITGSLQGTASWANNATTATSASSILAGDFAAGTYSIPWMSQKTPGIATYFEGDTVFQYETATGRVSATTFNGALSGNATTATTATTATSASTHLTTTNAVHYPVFVDANNSSPTSEKLGTVGNLTYNPNIGSLNATSFTGSHLGNTVGTASYATVASQSGYTIQMVLATTGSNLAAGTIYYMGAPVRNQLLSTSGRTRIYVPRPGKVKSAYVYVRTNGTLASAGTSTFHIVKTSFFVEQINTSTTVGSVADAALSSSAISMSVSQGDYLEVQLTTPAWGTLPTAVEANAIIYIENNI
tara:strand:- start:5166 stop:7019 length:1854 start_codon:yes stop_codon:yes gene_type:complete